MEDNQNPTSAGAQDDANSGGDDRSSRAKAFYRAMFAGGEPDPNAFGMDIAQQKPSEPDSHSLAAIAHLETSLKEMEQKFNDADNSYKRLAADFENYRKRMDREREEFQALGMSKALEAILPALDDFDMAQSKLTEATESKVMFDSIKMIYSRFMRCLEGIGIKQLEVKPGDMFDPNFHYGVASVPSRKYAEGTVANLLRPGYILRERVLRPSLVNVATTPDEDWVEPGSENENKNESETPEAQSAQPEPEPEQNQDQAESGSHTHVVDHGGSDPGAETSDSLDSISMDRATQDLPIEDIKAALHAEVEAASEEQEKQKRYELSDADAEG